MPFTPFHWGPALFVGIYTREYFDFTALMISSVLIDFRAAMVLFGFLEPPLHGSLHSFIGAIITAAATTALIYLLEDYRAKILDFIGFRQAFSIKKIFAGAVIGSWIHVILDAFIYSDMSFYLLNQNIFLGGLSTVQVYAFCIFTGVLGFLILLSKLDKSPVQITREINLALS